MHITIILCHPFERSYCHAIAQALVAGFGDTGADVSSHDLYAETPDPVLTGAEIARRYSLDEQIQGYTDEIVRTDLLAVVHPDWWSGPPALLKGWLERVLRPGIAYDWEGEEFEEKHHVPLLTNARLAVFVTTDREPDRPPEPIEGFWRDVADYSGMELARYTVLSDLRNSGQRQRRRWLGEAREWAKEVSADG
ncbi:MAG: NAD(P)H-dependent oxidoreductase [Spirochaetota bacterium]